MIVVSDTSPITSLLQIGQVELLATLYREVIIPEAVAEELRRGHSTLPSFVNVVRVGSVECVRRLAIETDIGEAEAIALMLEKRGDLLLIDERRGRRVAQRHGVPVIGLLGVLVEAKRHRLVVSLRQTIRQLQDEAGFRVSNELKERIFAIVGE